MHAVSQTIKIKNELCFKRVRVTPGSLHSESTVYTVYHLTLCQNYMITLFSFLAFAFSKLASLDGKNAM